jgi:hypothetical protein
MGKFRLPDGSIIELRDSAGGAVSKSQVRKPAVPCAARTTSSLPSQEEIVRRVRAELAKQGATDATVAKAEARERASKIETLEKQARDWRERAAEGRVTGLDAGIREYLISKAQDAEGQAAMLKSGAKRPKADLARAAKLDAEADSYDRQAADASDSGLRNYYRMRARDLREAAAIARGEKLFYDSEGKHLGGDR